MHGECIRAAEWVHDAMHTIREHTIREQTMLHNGA